MNRITALVALIMTVALSAPAIAQQPPRIEPKADEILKQMGDLLKASKSLSFDAHAVADQLSPEGQKLQYAKNQKITLRRPDKLACDMTGDNDELKFRYDGQKVTLFNPRTNSYGSIEAPKTIEDTLDLLAQKFGVAIPLADLLFSDPYLCLTENVRSGQYLGIGYVFDAKCHHLAFRQSAVDWQIWIDAGEKPLPRKVVITFKESPGHLQYTAFLNNWNLAAESNDAAFTFTPPTDAKKVEFAPATQPAGAK